MSKCGVNNANTHVKSIINGEIKEYDLCSECAKKWDTQMCSLTLRMNFQTSSVVSLATHFRQEHRQEDAKPVVALIRKLQNRSCRLCRLL